MAAAKTLTKAQLTTRARMAARARWAQEDPAENTARARRGFMARFEREVDPAGELPEAERQRRALSAMRAHMTRLSYLSSRARSLRARPR